MPTLNRVNLGLTEKLKNQTYRQKFFAGQAQDEFAMQLRSLRTKRKLSQAKLAEKSGMKQSAWSRIEQAGYSAWTFKTMLKTADALDARLRIILEPAEDVISFYQKAETMHASAESARDRATEISAEISISIGPARGDRSGPWLSNLDELVNRIEKKPPLSFPEQGNLTLGA